MALPILWVASACKTSRRVLSFTTHSIGTYENASIDTSIYGYYTNGQSLRGGRFKLYEDNTYSHEWYCDICPPYITVGTFTKKSNKLFFEAKTKITSDRLDNGGWVHDTTEYYNSYTMNIWRIENLTFISHKELDSNEMKILSFVLHDTIPEGLKVQVLPYRKMNWPLE